MVNWDDTATGNHYSVENRGKVQALLPDLAAEIADQNISVFFTATPKLQSQESNEFRHDIYDLKKGKS